MSYRLVLLSLLFICATQCYGQRTGCFKVDAQNNLGLESGIDFSKYNGFFVGEFHGVYGVPEIKLALIKYLNKNAGITDVFMEVGYSAAYLYNSYLETGDTSFITHPQLVYAVKQPDMDFWKGLYEYNRRLERKITIRGMDFERMEFIKVLKLLRPAEKERPDKIRSMLEYIDTVTIPAIGSLYTERQKVQDSVYEYIREAIIKNMGLYEQYYGADFTLVKQIMLNENTFGNFRQRNYAMYRNILKQAKEDSFRKFIVFCGQAHGNKDDEGYLCNLLLNDNQYKHKLVTIAMLCRNCYDWQQPLSGIAAYRAPYTYGKDSLLIERIYRKHFNDACKYQLISSKAVDDTRVRRFSDYMILMKDQPEY